MLKSGQSQASGEVGHPGSLPPAPGSPAPASWLITHPTHAEFRVPHLCSYRAPSLLSLPPSPTEPRVLNHLSCGLIHRCIPAPSPRSTSAEQLCGAGGLGAREQARPPVGWGDAPSPPGDLP